MDKNFWKKAYLGLGLGLCVVLMIAFTINNLLDGPKPFDEPTEVEVSKPTSGSTLAILMDLDGSLTVNFVGCVGGVSAENCEMTGQWRHRRGDFEMNRGGMNDELYEFVFGDIQCTITPNDAWCCNRFEVAAKSNRCGPYRCTCEERLAKDWYEVKQSVSGVYMHKVARPQ